MQKKIEYPPPWDVYNPVIGTPFRSKAVVLLSLVLCWPLYLRINCFALV